MTKKARDTKTPPAEVGALAEAAVTTTGPDAKSATEPAEVKKQLKKSLMGWNALSLVRIGRDETKALLRSAIKQCDQPPKKSGPKTKPPDIQALHFIGRTSVSAILAEGNIKKHRSDQLKAEQRRRQRALKKLRPTVDKVMLHLLIAAGVDTKTPGAVKEFCRAMNDTLTALQVLGKANAEIDPATIIATDE